MAFTEGTLVKKGAKYYWKHRKDGKVVWMALGVSIPAVRFHEAVQRMRLEVQSTAPPNPYSERINGSIRRERLDHVMILNERHLRRVLTAYFEYYNRFRVHQSLDMDAPEEKTAHAPHEGEVIAIPHGGGLHHHYERKAACAREQRRISFRDTQRQTLVRSYCTTGFPPWESCSVLRRPAQPRICL